MIDVNALILAYNQFGKAMANIGGQITMDNSCFIPSAGKEMTRVEK
jgi:hypothetical protein